MSENPPLADRPESWPVDSTRDLHRDHWVLSLREDRIRRPEHPEDEPFRRLVLEHPGAVIVLAVDDQDRVRCLWQYRHAAHRLFVELPAGLMDEGDETPEEVARRELREETGLEATGWTHLTTTWSSPGISEEVMHHFLATGLTDVGRGDFVAAHEEAEMVAGWVPFDDLLAAVLEGRVGDGPLVVAVLTAHARGLVGGPRQVPR